MKEVLVFFILFFLLGCSSLPNNSERTKSTALAPSSNTRLGRGLEKNFGPPRANESLFTPLVSGQDALLARLISNKLADRTLDIQYYIWANDLTGKLMMDSVLQAADRGVRVRILLDDLNQGKYQRTLAVLDTHPQIEVRLVNPFANREAPWMDVVRFSQVNKRMHNKVLIADNLLGIVGGRNIGNEYFWASESMNFGDFDLWAAGPVVRDLSKEFDAYWNSEISYPVSALMPDFRPLTEELDQLRQQAHAATVAAQETEYNKTLLETLKDEIFFTRSEPIFWSKAEVFFDPPAKFKQEASEQNGTLRHLLKPLVEETNKEMLLISPYFVPEDGGMEFFRGLQKKKIRTVVLTNSLASSDVATVFSGYKGYRKDLLRAGVELYELKPTASATLTKSKKHIGSSSSQSGLHGKVFIFDRKKIFVGSMNLDPRSLELNSEMGVVVHSPALSTYIAEGLLKNLKDSSYRLSLNDKNDLRWEAHEKGQRFEFSKDPETSWWMRFKAGFMSLVVPTSQL